MAVQKWSPIACIAVLLTVAHVAWAITKSQEIADNSISIRFDEVDLKTWKNTNGTDKFLDVISTSATSYCQNSMGDNSTCKIGTSSTPSYPFTKENIMIQSGYPKDENADVQIVFYISIEDQPKPAGVNQYALKNSVLTALLKDLKLDIGDAVSYDVVFIGDERVSAPLDSTLNTIMIPLAIAILVLLVLITLFLNYREKKNEKAAGVIASRKRPEIPAEDTHGEGMVLTAMNKGSSGDEDDNPAV